MIIIESTCPVGTLETLDQIISELRPDLIDQSAVDKLYHLAYCQEGYYLVIPFRISNDRLIGGIDARSAQLSVSFYKNFVQGDCIIGSVRSVELSKLAENAYRDVNIAFANELSLVCDDLDVDVFETIRLANHHPRVNILNPGVGVGGHCIAVDPWFIVSASEEAKIIKTARTINDSKPNWVIQKIKKELYSLSNLKEDAAIICYGLTYKADIDDVRESPSLKIYRALEREFKDRVFAVDPNLDQGDMNVKLLELDQAFEKVGLHVILVPHIEFKDIDFFKLTVRHIDFTGESKCQ